MGKHPTEKFPLESPSIIPGENIAVEFIEEGEMHAACIKITNGKKSLFLSKDQLIEVFRLSEGRLFNGVQIPDDIKASALHDQVFTMLRVEQDTMRDMAEKATAISMNGGSSFTVSGRELCVVVSALLMGIKVVRAMHVDLEE